MVQLRILLFANITFKSLKNSLSMKAKPQVSEIEK